MPKAYSLRHFHKPATCPWMSTVYSLSVHHDFSLFLKTYIFSQIKMNMWRVTDEVFESFFSCSIPTQPESAYHLKYITEV